MQVTYFVKLVLQSEVGALKPDYRYGTPPRVLYGKYSTRGGKYIQKPNTVFAMRPHPKSCNFCTTVNMSIQCFN